jgi:hypothetical protein
MSWVEFMHICLGRTYWHMDDKFFQNKYCNLVGSYSTFVWKVFMEHLKRLAHLFCNRQEKIVQWYIWYVCCLVVRYWDSAKFLCYLDYLGTIHYGNSSQRYSECWLFHEVLIVEFSSNFPALNDHYIFTIPWKVSDKIIDFILVCKLNNLYNECLKYIYICIYIYIYVYVYVCIYIYICMCVCQLLKNVELFWHEKNQNCPSNSSMVPQYWNVSEFVNKYRKGNLQTDRSFIKIRNLCRRAQIVKK